MVWLCTHDWNTRWTVIIDMKVALLNKLMHDYYVRQGLFSVVTKKDSK